MSHSRKHVTAGATQEFPVPEGEQEIVRVAEMRGGNIVEVERPTGEKLLCLMPAKFKKTLWIKRGNYLIIEPFTEVLNKADKKLRGRIATILFPDHVKYIERLGLWPSEWAQKPAGSTKGQQSLSDQSSNEADDGAASKESPKTKEQHKKQANQRRPQQQQQEADENDEDDLYFVNPNHRSVADSDDDDDDDDSDDEDDDEGEEDEEDDTD